MKLAVSLLLATIAGTTAFAPAKNAQRRNAPLMAQMIESKPAFMPLTPPEREQEAQHNLPFVTRPAPAAVDGSTVDARFDPFGSEKAKEELTDIWVSFFV